MEKLKERFIDERTGIEYIRKGDYYIPNLVIGVKIDFGHESVEML